MCFRSACQENILFRFTKTNNNLLNLNITKRFDFYIRPYFIRCNNINIYAPCPQNGVIVKLNTKFHSCYECSFIYIRHIEAVSMVETFTHIKTELKPTPIQSSFNDTEYAYYISKLISSTNILITGNEEHTYR